MPIETDPLMVDLVLTTVGNDAIADVRRFNAVSVQAVELEAAGGSPVVTIYRSNSMQSPAALESPITLSAPGMSAKIDCSGFDYLHAEVTTAATTTGKWRLYFSRKAVV